MAVADGKIISVGENKTVRRLAGAQTRLIDVRGKLVLPGFNDSHVHFTAIGNKFSHLDLRRMNSPDEIIAEVARYTRFLPQGRWIIAAGLATSGREISSILPLDLLDKASPDHPVIIFFADSSAIITNTAGLKLAGITTKTKDPSDGQILRDATGAPTGVFIGNAGELVRRYVPANHARNWSEIAETASNNAASLGITSVQDVHSDDMTETLRKLDTAGRLKTRVYECIGIDDWQKASVSAVGLVRTGCVKGTTFGIDGEDRELSKKIGPADLAGLQAMIHAIGASSNRNVLNAFEQIYKVNGQRDRRFRIEHVIIISHTMLKIIYTGFGK